MIIRHELNSQFDEMLSAFKLSSFHSAVPPTPPNQYELLQLRLRDTSDADVDLFEKSDLLELIWCVRRSVIGPQSTGTRDVIIMRW